MNFGRKKIKNKLKRERDKTKMNFGRGEKKEQHWTLGEREDKQRGGGFRVRFQGGVFGWVFGRECGFNGFCVVLGGFRWFL